MQIEAYLTTQILLSAMDSVTAIAKKIKDQTEKEKLINYIQQLQKGIKQRDEVIRTLITQIKNNKKEEKK